MDIAVMILYRKCDQFYLYEFTKETPDDNIWKKKLEINHFTLNTETDSITQIYSHEFSFIYS